MQNTGITDYWYSIYLIPILYSLLKHRNLDQQIESTETEMNSKIEAAEKLVKESAQRRARLEEMSDMRSPTPGRMSALRSPSPMFKLTAKSMSMGDLTEGDIDGKT